jgi:hypothetical protein
LDKDVNAEVDMQAQIEMEATNVGLLGALISTICFAMLQDALDDQFPIGGKAGMGYAICWAAASLLTLSSTILSVFLIMAIHETSSKVELDYFIAIFNQTTCGVGTMLPLLLCYVGCRFQQMHFAAHPKATTAATAATATECGGKGKVAGKVKAGKRGKRNGKGGVYTTGSLHCVT